MLAALKSLFAGGPPADHAANPKVTDLEARLAPPAGARGFGEVEYSAWADGAQSLDIELRDLRPGDVEVVIGRRIVTHIRMRGATADQHFSTRGGDHVAACRLGERVEIRQNGETILSGAFQAD